MYVIYPKHPDANLQIQKNFVNWELIYVAI